MKKWKKHCIWFYFIFFCPFVFRAKSGSTDNLWTALSDAFDEIFVNCDSKDYRKIPKKYPVEKNWFEIFFCLTLTEKTLIYALKITIIFLCLISAIDTFF